MLKDGDVVYIEYVGRLETGEVFDLTDEELAKKEGIFRPEGRYGPVPVIIGKGFIIKGLDEAVKELDVNKEKEILIPPEKAFGPRNPKLVKLVTTTWLEKRQIPATPGLVVDFGSVKGRIQSVSSGRVRIDFNNPLAGKTLKYQVKVVKKVTTDKGKAAAVVDYFTGKEPDVSVSKGEAVVKADIPPQLKELVSKLVLEVTKLKKVKFLGKSKATQP